MLSSDRQFKMRSDAITSSFFIAALLQNSISSRVLSKPFSDHYVQNPINNISKARRPGDASQLTQGRTQEDLNLHIVRPISTTLDNSASPPEFGDKKIYFIGASSELPPPPPAYPKLRRPARPRISADPDSESRSKPSRILPYQASSSLLNRRMVYGLNPKKFDGDDGSGWSTGLSLNTAQFEAFPSKHRKHKVRSAIGTLDQGKPDAAQDKNQEKFDDAAIRALCDSYLSAHPSNQAPDSHNKLAKVPDPRTSLGSLGHRDPHTLLNGTPASAEKSDPEDDFNTTNVTHNHSRTGGIDDLRAPISWCRRFFKKMSMNSTPTANSPGSNFSPDPNDLPASTTSTRHSSAPLEREDNAWGRPIKPH